MVNSSKLDKIYSAVNKRFVSQLDSVASVNDHPSMKGDASEEAWIDLIQDYLPGRYKVGSGKIIDSNGEESQQIDIIIYDKTYAPLLYTESGTQFIPAESVYAIFEVKQNLNKDHVQYAQDKIESVRKLHRTSAPIFSIHGKTDPKPLFEILGGILTLRSDYSPVIGESMIRSMSTKNSNRIDIGCSSDKSAFSIIYKGDELEKIEHSVKYPVAAFYMLLLERLACLATAPAIEYDKYQTVFEKKTYPENLA